MANRPAHFNQDDLKRAVKAVVSAGLPVGRVEIDNQGTIVIVCECSSSAHEKNDWD